ncbi:MAG: F0F1 ATP synthase subunit delta [Clostridiaceae bacterium]|nr:F0F1 ATP synthase subunit delta [Clostridiaceae bacterium]
MKKGILYVAGPFGQADACGIEERFSKMLGDKVVFDIKKNDELIGGFMAMVDGKVYDASILAQMKDIQRYMLDKE